MDFIDYVQTVVATGILIMLILMWEKIIKWL